MILFCFENSDTGNSKENRLIYVQYKNPTLKRAQETKEATKDTTELIQDVISHNPNKKEYKAFEGKSNDFRTLVEYIRLQKENNPTSPTGIDKNHPNLKKLAKEYFEKPKKTDALKSMNARLEGMRKGLAQTAKGVRAELFTFTNLEVNNAKQRINEVLLNQNTAELANVPFVEANTQGRSNELLTSPGYRNLINIIQTGRIIDNNQLQRNLLNSRRYLDQLTQARIAVDGNAKKGRSVLNNISNTASPQETANAQRYVGLIEKEQIEFIDKHIEFVSETCIYLKAMEASPKMQAIDDLGIRLAIRQNEADIKTQESIKINATQANDPVILKNAETELEALKGAQKILKGRLGMTTESRLAFYEDLIEDGQSRTPENVQMAMDMYLMVMDEIKQKYGKQLPRDPRTRAYLLTTAMLEGVDAIDRFAELEGVKIGPHYKIQEKKGSYKHDTLFQGKAFNLDSENETFLDTNRLPKKEIIKEFELASYEQQIKSLHSQIEVDLIVLRIVYGLALDEDYTPDEEFYKECKERLGNMHNKAILLNKTLNKYITIDGATLLTKNDIATASKISGRVMEINMIPEASCFYWKSEKAEIRKELSKTNRLYIDINTLTGRKLAEDYILELNSKIAYVDKDKMKILSDRIKRIKEMLKYEAGSVAKVAYLEKINNSLGKHPLDKNVLYRIITDRNIASMLPKNKEKWTEIAKKIKAGDSTLSAEIIHDINNNFVHRRNEIKMKELASILKIPEDKVKDFFKNVETQALEGLSEFERVCKANEVIYEGAFYHYFDGGYWSDPKTNVDMWEEDLNKKLAEGKGGESAATTVLFRVLKANPGKEAFLNALKDPKHPEHDNARELLKEFIREFQRRTTWAQEDLKNQIDYEEGTYDKGNTLMERVHKIGGHVFDNIFGSGVRPEVRFIYGFMAYMVLSKGISGKGFWGKFVRGTGAALGIGMIYENATGKPALGFLGIDSAAASARGSWLHKEAKNSGIDQNDQASYRALDTLKDKKVEDIIKWYDGRDEYGWTTQDKTKNRGYSHYSSLVRSGLLKPRELDEIMPDETNKEEIGKKFVDVIKKQLLMIGKRATQGTITDEEQLIRAGRNKLYHSFTAKGFKESAEAGNILYMAPDEAKKLKDGSYKWNYKEASEIMSTAAEWEKANREQEGLLGVPSWLYNEMVEYKNKALPSWLKLKGHAKYMTDETIRKFSEDYGPEAWSTMKEWGEKGWEFTMETGKEISVWWKEGETALKIKRTAGNMWEIITTGAKLPFVATLELGDRGTDTLAKALNKVETKIYRWSLNEKYIVHNMFPDETGAFDIQRLRLPGSLKERQESWKLNFITNGYEMFGKYEEDWYDWEDNTGLLARKELMTKPMQRFDFKVPEGYVNFMGICKDTTKSLSEQRNDAYRDAVKNLETFFYTEDVNHIRYLDYLNPNDEFTKAIISRNKSKIRANVEPFIQRYGAFHSTQNGYLLFLRIPTPIHEQHRATREYTYIDQATGKEKTKKVRLNYEYYLRKNKGDWNYGDLEDYKHTIVFGIDEVIPPKYVSSLSSNEAKKFMKAFSLWQAKDSGGWDLKKLLDHAQAAAEGEPLMDYGKNDNLRIKFFEAIKKNYQEKFLEEQHWLKSHKKMERELIRKFKKGSTMVKQFNKYHTVIAEAAKEVSVIAGAKEYINADAAELA